MKKIKMISGYTKKQLINALNKAYFPSLTDADYKLAKKYNDEVKIVSISEITKLNNTDYIVDTNMGEFSWYKNRDFVM